MTRTRFTLRVLDAKDACLQLLMARRTKGRFELFLRVTELYEALR